MAGLVLVAILLGGPLCGFAASPGSSSAGPHFSDVGEAAGLIFDHTHGRADDDPARYYIETMCGGVAFFDFDADGHVDAYGVNGQHITDASQPRATNRLFRNAGDGTFVDVTEPTAAGDEGYGMGVTAGDYDGDGFDDLYVTNFGANSLLGSAGGRRFESVAARVGVADTLWGVGAAFLDYDNDGDLDLYVANYVDYELADAQRQLRPYVAKGTGDPTINGYPHPDNFDGAADVLFRNDGSRFTDVTHPAGVYNAGGKGMGLAVADYDDDGDVDVFVANDRTENFLYQNSGAATFVDVGLLAGTSYDRDGRPQSGMGADFADADGDGLLDLFLTVYQAETNALYRNEGGGFFADGAYAAGLAVPSLPYVSWGAVFLDYDNDGRRDLFVANGHVLDNAELFDSASRYRQPNQLFRNLGPDAAGRLRFTDVASQVGAALAAPHPSRGVASADYDNDGDVDLLVLNLNERASLLRNDGGGAGHWLTVQVAGGPGQQHAIGARVRVVAGDLTQIDQVLTAGSYLSQSDLRVHFGLGGRTVVDTVEVRWPGGGLDRVGPLAADQIITVTTRPGRP